MNAQTRDFVFEPFVLPVFDQPQTERRNPCISWEEVICETEPVRLYYLEHFDSPERRLREKNPAPFRMDD